MFENLPRFGATDFYTIETDPLKIKEELRAALGAHLGYTPTDADPFMALAFSLMPYFVQTRALADAAAKSTLLSYAVGQSLDRIADATVFTNYITRLKEIPSKAAVRVVISVDGKDYWTNAPRVDFTLVGAKVTSDGVTFKGDVVARLKYDGDNEQYVGNVFLPEENGARVGFKTMDAAVESDRATFNGVEIGNDWTGVNIRAVSVAPGRDAESDDEFAAALRETQLGLRTPHSRAWYLSQLRGIEGVYDVTILDAAYSDLNQAQSPRNGALQVIVLPEYAVNGKVAMDSAETIGSDGKTAVERVVEVLRAIQGVGVRFLVKAASFTNAESILVQAHLPDDADDAAEQSVRAAFAAYVRRVSNRLGVLIRYDELEGELVSAGAEYAKVLDVGAADFFRVADNTFVNDSSFSFEVIKDVSSGRVGLDSDFDISDGEFLA